MGFASGMKISFIHPYKDATKAKRFDSDTALDLIAFTKIMLLASAPLHIFACQFWFFWL